MDTEEARTINPNSRIFFTLFRNKAVLNENQRKITTLCQPPQSNRSQLVRNVDENRIEKKGYDFNHKNLICLKKKALHLVQGFGTRPVFIQSAIALHRKAPSLWPCPRRHLQERANQRQTPHIEVFCILQFFHRQNQSTPPH